MPIFVCARCSSLDNTACSRSYWRRLIDGVELICTACETGEWHGRFPQRTHDVAKDGPFNWKSRQLAK